MLYITYARPFWLDVYNFDRKRYHHHHHHHHNNNPYARPFWLDVYNFDRKRYTELTPTYRELLFYCSSDTLPQVHQPTVSYFFTVAPILYRRYTNLP